MDLDTTKYTNEDLDSLTVNQIRKLCKNNGIKAVGKKAKLVDLLLSVPALDDTDGSKVVDATQGLDMFSRKLKQKEDEMDKLVLQVEKPFNAMLSMLQTEKQLLDERRHQLEQLAPENKCGGRRRSHVVEMNELRSELEEKENLLSEREGEMESLSKALRESRELVAKYKVFTQGVITLRVRNVSTIERTTVTSGAVMVCNLPWTVKFMTKNIPDEQGRTVKYAGLYLRCEFTNNNNKLSYNNNNNNNNKTTNNNNDNNDNNNNNKNNNNDNDNNNDNNNDNDNNSESGECGCRARGTFSLKCHKGNDLVRKTMYKALSRDLYSADHVMWGFATFVPWTHLTNTTYGYTVDDEVVITTHVDVT